MAPHTWSHLGDTATDTTDYKYYRGQRIKEAYYRGEKIWGDEFLGILLANLPHKLHYTKDEQLNYSGAMILGVWTGGRTKDITEDCEFFPNELTFIDPSTVLLGIIPEQLPEKTNYSEGELVDYSGVAIHAVYADGHTVDVTENCVFEPENQSIVNPPSIIGIVTTKLPTKSIYSSDEEIDYSGVKIMAVHSNGRCTDVTNECVFNLED